MLQSSSVSILLSVVFIYIVFILLTIASLLLSRRFCTHTRSKLQPGLLSPLGSLYIFTTAFLLSNVLFQTNNLRNAVSQEVVTFSKLGEILSVLPPEQRVEGRRLLFDYAYSIAYDEANTMKRNLRSEDTEKSLDLLRGFLASPSASLSSDVVITPESSNYLRRASDFSFDLLDARERRLSLSVTSNPPVVWISIAVMYLAFSFLAFTVHNGMSSLLWMTSILLVAFPIPAVMLFLYSNPIAAGVFDLTAQYGFVLARHF